MDHHHRLVPVGHESGRSRVAPRCAIPACVAGSCHTVRPGRAATTAAPRHSPALRMLPDDGYRNIAFARQAAGRFIRDALKDKPSTRDAPYRGGCRQPCPPHVAPAPQPGNAVEERASWPCRFPRRLWRTPAPVQISHVKPKSSTSPDREAEKRRSPPPF